MRLIFFSSFILISFLACAQFAPAAGEMGSTAIFKEDASVSFWADSIVFERRGWLDIADTSLGKVDFGLNQEMKYQADGLCYSLGDSGEVILSFPFPIYNEAGFDFAVFENGFASIPFQEDYYFLELGHVSVSYDGINYFTFESTSLTNDTDTLGSFGYVNVREINNLAGKYETNYGTPFDLNELGIDSIRYVKVVDAIGTINSNHATYDANGNKVVDPYPTPFPSGGFDVDGIAALNQKNTNTGIRNLEYLQLNLYPNPIKACETLHYAIEEEGSTNVKVYNAQGSLVYQNSKGNQVEINTCNWSVGVYIISINLGSKIFNGKIQVQ